jgi:hypothetical protein
MILILKLISQNWILRTEYVYIRRIQLIHAGVVSSKFYVRFTDTRDVELLILQNN